jgi:hypothetical protein
LLGIVTRSDILDAFLALAEQAQNRNRDPRSL